MSCRLPSPAELRGRERLFKAFESAGIKFARFIVDNQGLDAANLPAIKGIVECRYGRAAFDQFAHIENNFHGLKLAGNFSTFKYCRSAYLLFTLVQISSGR